MIERLVGQGSRVTRRLHGSQERRGLRTGSCGKGRRHWLIGTVLVMVWGSASAQICPPGNPRVAPDSRYAISEPVAGEKVVTDRVTGLVWKRCSEGLRGDACEIGTLTGRWWEEAHWTANPLIYAGFSDWRVPNRDELLSLVEAGCFGPAINGVVFPGTRAGLHWTSTPTSVQWYSWVVDFRDGSLNAGNKRTPQSVRLVRGGSGFAAFNSGDFRFRDDFEVR
jgi:hypothetical protein